MAHIHISGAGITGPVAALALIHTGHSVTVHERRQRHEIFSTGVIGITEENCDLLTPYGVDLNSIALDNMYYEWSTDGVSSWRFTTEKFVVWTHIHTLLTEAAESHGARFAFGSKLPGHGTRVHASGLGYARSRGLKPTPRYLVYRGVSAVNTDFAWLSLNDPDQRFSFKLAHTPLGAAWELYVHRTEIPHTSQPQNELPPECAELPKQFRQITDATVELATSPISDWEIASKYITDDGITIGDANGGLRPHSGMGANRGIAEAIAVPALLDGDVTLESQLVAQRLKQHVRGAAIGRKVMGK
jgi:2-polyprenyl-6-methoxyphenol hydroxylase-like FAD-dependent oxidoreductase